MDIKDQKQGKAVVVSLQGSLDTDNSPDVQRHVKQLLDTGETFFVMDLGGLEYVSSAGLRAFLSLAKQAKAAGGGVAFLQCARHGQGAVRHLPLRHLVSVA